MRSDNLSMAMKPSFQFIEEFVCPECGLRSGAGELRCEEHRDVLLTRDFEQPVLFWRFHRMAVDAYCVQHSPYIASAKSLAAHLCGLCIAIERGNDAEALSQLQRWLSTNPKIEKHALPMARGAVTIGSVYGIDDPVLFGKAVENWARNAWNAYRELQPLARTWLEMSMQQGMKAGPSRRSG
jgi:hypothetical protein